MMALRTEFSLPQISQIYTESAVTKTLRRRKISTIKYNLNRE
jgi:hypothetical protein